MPAGRGARARKEVSYNEDSEADDEPIISDEEEAADEDHVEEEDEDAGFTRKRKAAPKAKKAGAGAGSASAAKAPAQKKAATASSSSPQTIFSAVSSNRSLTSVVSGFLRRYQEDSTRGGARVELLTFLFRAAGAQADVVDPSAADAPDGLDVETYAGQLSEVLEDSVAAEAAAMTSDEGDAEGGGPDYYPLHPSPNGTAKRRAANAAFREGFVAFWSSLISHATLDTLVGGPDVVDGVVNDILIPCASASLRSLRHAGTLASMAVGSALLVKAGEQRGQLTSLQRTVRAEEDVLSALQAKVDQMEAAAEAAAGGSKKGRFAPKGGVSPDLAGAREALQVTSAKVSELTSQVTALSDSITLLHNAAVSGVFEGVFVHRYRDVDGHIRRDALAQYGTWLTSAPESLLANSYLKYLGWMLNDRASADVRRTALACLRALYSLPPDQVEKLQEFTARFRGRVAGMLADADVSTSHEALGLLRAMLLADQLSVEEVKAVRGQLVSQDVHMRRGAGAFLLDQLPAFGLAGAAGEDGEEGEGGEDEDMDGSGAGAGGGKRGKAGGAAAKEKVAASRKAAREAAAQAAQARRYRTQLLSLVMLAKEIANPSSSAEMEEDDEDEEGSGVTPTLAVEYVISAFWGHAEAAVLTHWQTYISLLTGAGSDVSSSVSAAEAEAGLNADTGELTAEQQKLTLRLLACAAQRACGRSKLDGAVGVPVPPKGSGAGANSSSGTRAAGGSPLKPSRGAGAGGDDDSDAAADGAAFALSTSPDVIEKSRGAMSSELAPALPDLLFKYGPDPQCVSLLASVITAMSLSSFGVARLSKAFSDLVYHLTRLTNTHTTSAQLRALAACMSHLTSEGHPKARDAQAAVAKLASSLAAKAVGLIATVIGEGASSQADSQQQQAGKKGKKKAPAKGKKGGRKGGAAASEVGGVSESKGGDMDLDEEEGNDDDDEVDGAGASGTAAVTLLAVLRRLSALSEAVDLGSLTSSDFTPSSSLVSSLSRLLRYSRRLNALFTTAAQEAGDDDVTGGLHYELVASSLSVLRSLMQHTLTRGADLAASVDPRKASDAEKAAVQALAADASSYRDVMLPHLVTFLGLRHPDVIAAAVAQAKAAGDGGASVDSAPSGGDHDSEAGGANSGHGTSAAALQAASAPETFALPPNATKAQSRYIWRCRLTAYRTFAMLAVACSPSSLGGSLLAEAQWQPSEETLVAHIHIFVNAALNCSPSEMGLMGLHLTSLPAAAVGAFLDGEADEGEMEEEEQDAAVAEPAARQALEAQREADLQRVRARYILAPLAQIALCAPGCVKLTNLLAGRQMEDSNEAGKFGVRSVHATMTSAKKRDPEAMLGMQLGALEEATTILQQYAGMAEEAAASGDAEAHAGYVATIAGVVTQVAALVRKQTREVHPVGKVKDATLAMALMHMLQKGITSAVGGAPDTLHLFGFLAAYLPLLPAEYFDFLLRYLDQQVRQVVGKTDAQPLMSAANKWWVARQAVTSDGDVTMGTQSAEFGGYTQEQLRPWAPCMAFRRALEAARREGGHTRDVAANGNRALRVALGLPDTGAGGAAGGPSQATGGGTARKARGTAAATGTGARRQAQRQVEKGDEEEADEGSYAGGSVSVSRRLQLAGTGAGAGGKTRGTTTVSGSTARSGVTGSRSRGRGSIGSRAAAAGGGVDGDEEEDSQLLGDGEISLVRRPSEGGISLSITQGGSSANGSSSQPKRGKSASGGSSKDSAPSRMISLTGQSQSQSQRAAAAAAGGAGAGRPQRKASTSAAAASKGKKRAADSDDEDEEEEQDDDEEAYVAAPSRTRRGQQAAAVEEEYDEEPDSHQPVPQRQPSLKMVQASSKTGGTRRPSGLTAVISPSQPSQRRRITDDDDDEDM